MPMGAEAILRWGIKIRLMEPKSGFRGYFRGSGGLGNSQLRRAKNSRHPERRRAERDFYPKTSAEPQSKDRGVSPLVSAKRKLFFAKGQHAYPVNSWLPVKKVFRGNRQRAQPVATTADRRSGSHPCVHGNRRLNARRTRARPATPRATRAPSYRPPRRWRNRGGCPRHFRRGEQREE